jgi:predicted DNA-binding transcriptional regulator AlpA
MGMEYVGARELALLLGLGDQEVGELAAADDFPEPLMELASGAVWELADIEDWARRTGRPLVPDGGPA